MFISLLYVDTNLMIYTDRFATFGKFMVPFGLWIRCFHFIIRVHFAIISYYHYCYDYTTRNIEFCDQIITHQKVLANNVLLAFFPFLMLWQKLC